MLVMAMMAMIDCDDDDDNGNDDDDDDGGDDNNLYFAMGSKCRAVCYY